jgi:hypothetical protein
MRFAGSALVPDRSFQRAGVDPDDGSFEFKGPSRAYGYEGKASVSITRRLPWRRSPRLRGQRPPHFVANAALTLAGWHGFSGSLRMRAVNHYWLDGEVPSIVASGHTIFDMGGAAASSSI